MFEGTCLFCALSFDLQSLLLHSNLEPASLSMLGDPHVAQNLLRSIQQKTDLAWEKNLKIKQNHRIIHVTRKTVETWAIMLDSSES